MSTQTTSDADPNQGAPAGIEPSRFCSSCSRTKPVSGGNLVRCANGAKRWKCAGCIARSKAHQASRQTGETPAGEDQT